MGLASCTLCDVHITSLHEHAQTSEHRFRYLQKYYTVNRSTLLKAKKGVNITTAFNEDCPPHVKENEGKITMYLKKGCGDKVTVCIFNNNEHSAVNLQQAVALYTCPSITLSDEHDIIGGQKIIKLSKGAKYKFQFEARAGGCGVQELPLVFQFTLENSNEIYFILRILCVQFLDDVAVDTLPTSLFTKHEVERSMQRPPPSGSFVRGRAAPGCHLRGLDWIFAHYYPDILLELVRCKFDAKRLRTNELMEENRRILLLMREGLRPDNYQEWFQTQLWIEEIQRESDLKHFHQTNVPLSRSTNPEYSDTDLVQIQVPGMLEKRPDIMLGDCVFIRPSGQQRPCMEGIVHHIVEETVYLGFNQTFWDDFNEGMPVDIQFWYNRTTFVRSHMAIEYCGIAKNILFPSSPGTTCPLVTAPLQFYDSRVAGNTEQRQAVEAIAYKFSAPAPYILFGPPGTGKTLTIVEAIKQVYKMDTNCRILVSAPSNPACDVVTERLLSHIPPEHLRRIFATSRDIKTIPCNIRPVSNIVDNKIHIPSLDELATYRVIVTTFMTAARVISLLVEGTEPQSEFTHIFLDECGHGQEPEALIPLLGMGEMVILAGDHLQLGPVVFSKICLSDGLFFKNSGLDQSLLERLMKMNLYKANSQGHFNPRFVTKLLDNYRSHADILHIPNELFYNSELRPRGDPKLINSLLKWKMLPNKTVPLLFHGVNGKDDREGNNPSYFNPQEVSEVVAYVQKLKSGMQMKPTEIGIVAPYRAQIKKIRTALLKQFPGWALNLRVGSPEEFQGDERRVIIVSTVRADAEHLYNDIFMQLGFLRNPKRFNVTVTRAQALLVVVGCPWLLRRDRNWGALLSYCHSKGSYIGCKYEELQNEEVNDIYKKMDDLEIDVTQAEA